jgi:hypothetical protein
MKKLIFSLIAVTIVLSSCGPAFIATGPGNGRGYDERGYDSRGNDRRGYDNRGRAAKAKQIRVKPGRHNIKVYSNGRFLYERWVVATPNRSIRFSV